MRITLGNSNIVGYPEAGGLAMIYLQYLLGLQDLGHDVLWLELFHASGDPTRDQYCLATFFARMQTYGIAERVAVLVHEHGTPLDALESCQANGWSLGRIREFFTSSDLVLNMAGALPRVLLDLARWPVFVDIDPGHLQISALQWDMGLQHHKAFLTVGAKVHQPDCGIPSAGVTWKPFLPFVYLPLWPLTPDPGPQAPFTSVTQWNWEELWFEDKPIGISKRQAYLCYLDLPRRTQRPFLLAANIHPDDNTGDRELLHEHGWQLVHPHEAAGSPADYQGFIRASRAEIQCPKGVFTALRTGWISDRSVCYLATGRPVLAEDTGFTDLLPGNHGLVSFADMESAAAGVASIDGDYKDHARAARELAESVFDSRRILPALLAACEP